MAKEQKQEHEPEMGTFVLHMDGGQVITVEFQLDELGEVRDGLEAAMQSGGVWYVGDYSATLNGHEIEIVNARRIIAYT